MKCNHETEHLVGMSDGILCKKCGCKFDNFQEIEKSRDGLKNENLTDKPEKDGEADNSIEKEKKTAVQAQDSKTKVAKTTRKKAVSKDEK